jgi:MOSC domain-containing protein YiiM
MKVLSLNVGKPREVMWHGRAVTTGIFKTPVPGRVALRTLNFDGDGQADLRVHGGTHKAVYCYQRQHYDYWRAELPGTDLPFGMFGENLTIDGPGEDDIHLGDAFTVGSAAVVVTQPRLPCYKLGLKFQSDDMVKRFLASRRTGFYLAVTREGDVGAGDDLVEIARDPNAVPVSDVTRLYVTKRYNADDTASMQRILQVSAVPDSWKEWFRGRLADV